jgi:putative membrane protein
MVKTAAMKSGLKPKPPVLEPKQETVPAALRQVSGAARDTLHVSQQNGAHQDASPLTLTSRS